MDKQLEQNRSTWNIVAPDFLEASSLPVWGPFGVGDDLGLLSNIEGMTFIELACGSGRSINYLMQRGAKHVYGVDFSEAQLAAARSHNQKSIVEGNVELIHSTMEARINQLEGVADIAFSVYGIGWTVDPETTLKNIFAYLKAGGQFIWSWDHTMFTCVGYEDEKFSVVYPYHAENLLNIQNWKREGCTINVVYRKTSTWFQLLRSAGFDVIGYYEPHPKDLSRGHNDPAKYYSIQKAELVPSTIIFQCQKPY